MSRPKLEVSQYPKAQWQRLVRKAKKRFEALKDTDRIMAGRFVNPLFLYNAGDRSEKLFEVLSFLMGEKVEVE